MYKTPAYDQSVMLTNGMLAETADGLAQLIHMLTLAKHRVFYVQIWSSCPCSSCPCSSSTHKLQHVRRMKIIMKAKNSRVRYTYN
jgi:hypothetical protein